MQEIRQERQTPTEPGVSTGRRRLMSGRGLSRQSLFLRRCKECGVPLGISRNHVWEEHGRILSPDSAQRLMIVETGIVDGILDRVVKRTGEQIRSLFTESKAFDSSHYVRALFSGWKKVGAGYPLFKKPFYELLCDHARLLGMADARILDYKRGNGLVIACTQCYSRDFFAGDIMGAIYAAEGKLANVEIRDEGSQILFEASFQGADPQAIERHEFSWEAPLAGHINYRRCKNCGIPFSVSFFSWNPQKGTMVDTHNGQEVALMNVAGINIIYDEVKAMLGDEVDAYLMNTLKEMVDQILPGLEWKHRRPEEAVHDLFFLAYRGMGNPIFTEKISDGIKARVENPFNYPMVAGIAASFLARGRPVHVEWERSMPGRLEIYVHFI
jgi:hypothetical protein